MKDNVRTTVTRRGLAGLAAGVGLAVALTACGGSDPLATPSTSAASGGAGGSLTGRLR